ncbi:hypothetical protein ACF3DV_29445 [Chlorogloeopsis fritschii PCC 9212]|uniref:Cell division protein FtsL n=1 Tax=Chlorogloeopsis fritschii PCC 6912 TaxID=211165 RepID=A0A3S1AKQ9_CHLFR|nr:hypothetical protein [Chlorogloeopsis fritschii]RUR83109.1 hypothetical protein PCC6912_24830 [Chlorogloeopsis fritschii PCC 6912]
MAVARKLDVSTKRSWFRRGGSLSGGSTTREQRLKSLRTATAKALPTKSSQRQRRSLQNKSAPATQFKDSAGAVTTTAVSDLSKQGTAPLWLLRLYTLYRHSSVMTFLLVAAMLVVYGWTVYSQQIWSQTYRKLQTLQREERQLTTNNEVLKNQMAQEAQTSAAGLVTPSPTGTVFLRPAPESSNSEVPNATFNAEPQQQKLTPVGY